MSDTPEKIVRCLLQVISRQQPFSVAEKLLDNNLQIYMDGRLLAHNAQAWFRWIRFLIHCADKKMSDFVLVIDSISNVKNMVAVTAHWCGVINGKESVSEKENIRYQVRDNKVVSIWTHKKNYVFIHGNYITTPLFFYFLIVRMMLWCCLSSKCD